MSDPYLGEIRMFAGNFAPVDWALCQGQLLSIAEYSALYAVIGTTYGGDGQTTFALPDLRSRIPLHQGQGAGLSPYAMGQTAGLETVVLLPSQIPAHQHTAACVSGGGNSSAPANNFWSANAATKQYTSAGTFSAALNASSISTVGSSQAHDNMLPYLTINFIIALAGIYPSRS